MGTLIGLEFEIPNLTDKAGNSVQTTCKITGVFLGPSNLNIVRIYMYIGGDVCHTQEYIPSQVTD